MYAFPEVQHEVSDHEPPLTDPVKLTWRQGEPAPEHMESYYGSAVVHGNTAYFSWFYNVYLKDTINCGY